MATLSPNLEAPMGRIDTMLTIANAMDQERVVVGEINAAAVRSVTLTSVLVDTGATFLSLPADLIVRLGLRFPRPPDGRIIAFFHPDVHVEVRRIGAAGFDLLVLLVLQTWVNDVFGVTRVTGGSPTTPIGGGYAYFTSTTTVDLPWLALLALVVFGIQEALFGATWGKLLTGLRVVDAGGGRPTLTAVFVRNAVRLIDYWPGFYAIGIVAALLSPRRQRLGDRAARTLVVRAETAPLARRSPGELRVRSLGLAGGLLLFTAFCLGFSYIGRPPLVIAGMANTSMLPGSFGQAVASYRLGAAHWGNGAVTYPISYATVVGRKTCSGSITLRWHGFFAVGGGWKMAGGELHCRS